MKKRILFLTILCMVEPREPDARWQVLVVQDKLTASHAAILDVQGLGLGTLVFASFYHVINQIQ